MPDRWRVALYLSASCGLRSGEVRSLQRGDIVLPEPTDKASDGTAPGLLHVRRGVVELHVDDDACVLVDTPKTTYSVRDVAIPPWLVPVLRAHLAQFVGARDDAWLFTSPEGGPLRQMTLWRAWDKARGTAGIPSCRWHDLRHYAATMAVVAGGASEYEARRMLGQNDSKVLRRYLDDIEGRQATIARHMPVLTTTGDQQ
jgi:integrase